MAISSLREPLRPLQLGAYAFLGLTLFFQLTDFLLAIVPIRPVAVVWRYSALNQFAGQVGNFLLILLLLQILAVLLNDRRAMAVVSGVDALFAIFLLFAAAGFALDTVQLRSRVDAQMVSKFDLQSGVTIAKYLLQSAVSALLAWSAWKIFNSLKRENLRGDRVSEEYLVVRGPTRSA